MDRSCIGWKVFRRPTRRKSCRHKSGVLWGTSGRFRLWAPDQPSGFKDRLKPVAVLFRRTIHRELECDCKPFGIRNVSVDTALCRDNAAIVGNHHRPISADHFILIARVGILTRHVTNDPGLVPTSHRRNDILIVRPPWLQFQPLMRSLQSIFDFHPLDSTKVSTIRRSGSVYALVGWRRIDRWVEAAGSAARRYGATSRVFFMWKGSLPERSVVATARPHQPRGP